MAAYLLVLFISLTPFLHGFGYFDTYELPKFVWIVALAVIFGLLFCGNISHLKILRKLKVNTSLLIILLVGVFASVNLLSSYLSGGSSTLSFFGQFYRYNGILFYLAITLIFLILRNAHFKDVELNWFIDKVIAYTGIALSAHILLDFVGINSSLWKVADYLGRPVGTFGNPNHAGGYLAMILAFVLSGHEASKNHVSRIIFSAIIIAGIIATGSLSALLSLCVVFALSVLISKTKSLPMLAIFAGLLLVSITLFIFVKNQNIQNSRPEIWRKSLEAIYKKPILGWGIENIDLAIHSQLGPNDFYMKEVKIDRSHNIWLDTAIQTGLVGLVLRLVVIGMLIKSLLNKNKLGYARAALFLLIAFEIFAMFNVIGISQYILLIVLLAFAYNKNLHSASSF